MSWGLAAMGVAIGIAVAAPIGPINLMCIRNGLERGLWAGFLTGAGAVLGDGTFAVIAAFGLTAVSAAVSAYIGWIQAIGGVALVAIGLKTLLTIPDARAEQGRLAVGEHVSLIGTTYFLTITNPATIFGFVAIFGGIGNLALEPGDYAGTAVLVGAVMLGSLLWWLLLSWFVSLFRHKFDARRLRLVNIGSGLVITAFGVVILAQLLGTIVSSG